MERETGTDNWNEVCRECKEMGFDKEEDACELCGVRLAKEIE